MCDTVDFWISTKRSSVIRMFKQVDAVVINDEEARLLTKEFNLIKCAKKIMSWGTKYVVIKNKLIPIIFPLSVNFILSLVFL